MSKTPIERAIDILGSQAAMAEAIDVSKQFISQMANGDRPVPARLVMKIEAATDGKITRWQLRPDIFGTWQGKKSATA